MSRIRRSAGWRGSLAAVASAVAAILPVGACPVCWPVYSGILSAVGLTFLLDTAYVLWITLALSSLALLALGFRAKERRGYGPLILGAASVGAILFFKFQWMAEPLVYAGISGLAVASFWNAWPREAKTADACFKCAGTAS